MLVSMIRPKNILEIGTFSGYSALCMAEALEAGDLPYFVFPSALMYPIPGFPEDSLDVSVIVAGTRVLAGREIVFIFHAGFDAYLVIV